MPTAVVDGIITRCEVIDSGPPLLPGRYSCNWDVTAAEQTEANTPARMLEFLDSMESRAR